VPNELPSIAPINNDGANTPPDPPDPNVSDVAMIFNPISPKTKSGPN